jgi:hypothetical protein
MFHVVLDMQIQTKKSRLVCPKNHKIGDNDRCNIPSLEKNTTKLSKFYVPKYFMVSVHYLLSFNGKQFLFFAERGTMSRKKNVIFLKGK